MKSSTTLTQLLGWVYCAMFVAIAALAYIPGLTYADGNLFGLFKLDLYDNLLHLGSGIWAGLAAWHSFRWSQFYFRLFGLIYGLDGVIGLLFGQAYLDGGIFRYGITELDWLTKFLTNIPHILIGGIAVYIGFVLSRRVTQK
jgi:hypothetical protein